MTYEEPDPAPSGPLQLSRATERRLVAALSNADRPARVSGEAVILGEAPSPGDLPGKSQEDAANHQSYLERLFSGEDATARQALQEAQIEDPSEQDQILRVLQLVGRDLALLTARSISIEISEHEDHHDKPDTATNHNY